MAQTPLNIVQKAITLHILGVQVVFLGLGRINKPKPETIWPLGAFDM